ncbi:MAG: hypothetical protein ACXVJK_08375, partial [Candidatus Aminicenantales bacterium]
MLLGPAWAFYAARKSRPCFGLLLLAVAACGAAVYSERSGAYEANALHRYEGGDYVDVAGTLLGSPGREPGRDILLIQVKSV